jgi:hypothetical protein
VTLASAETQFNRKDRISAVGNLVFFEIRERLYHRLVQLRDRFWKEDVPVHATWEDIRGGLIASGAIPPDK